MKRFLMVVLGLLVLLGAGLASTAQAHEFIIKPVLMETAPDTKLPFSVVSAHVYMVSEEMEPLDKVELQLVTKSGTTPLKLEANEMLMTLDGQVEAKGEGTQIMAGHRQGLIWTETTEGWKLGSKKGLSGVLSSGLYEKFCKTLITVGRPDDGYSKVLGHTLEIVPLTDPAKAQVGQNMEFQILYQGKPLSTKFWATFDGFSTVPNTHAYGSETTSNNTALVKITHPGTWMVQAEKAIDQPTDDYDRKVIRAVLVFEVK